MLAEDDDADDDSDDSEDQVEPLTHKPFDAEDGHSEDQAKRKLPTR